MSARVPMRDAGGARNENRNERRARATSKRREDADAPLMALRAETALAAGATVCLPPSDALRRRAGGTKSTAAGDDAGLFTQLDDDEGA